MSCSFAFVNVAYSIIPSKINFRVKAMFLHGHLRLMLCTHSCVVAITLLKNLCGKHGFRCAFCTISPLFGLYRVKCFKIAGVFLP